VRFQKNVFVSLSLSLASLSPRFDGGSIRRDSASKGASRLNCLCKLNESERRVDERKRSPLMNPMNNPEETPPFRLRTKRVTKRSRLFVRFNCIAMGRTGVKLIAQRCPRRVATFIVATRSKEHTDLMTSCLENALT